MKPKKAYIAISDFKRHINDWCSLRVVMNHQPSSIAAGKKDLAVFTRYCAKKHIGRIYGTTLLAFFAYLKDTRKNCAGSINRKRSTLRCYCNHLRLRQVSGAKAFPIEHLPNARHPYSGPIHTLEPAEVEKILLSIDRSCVIGLRNFTLFSLLYAYGLRLGEALGLQLADIDWKKELVTIHGKGRKTRYLPLTDKISALLKNWIKYRAALLNADSAPYLFLSKKGLQLSGRVVEEHFKEIVTKLGPFTINKVTPHSLRHAFASHAVDGNADLIVLKNILGHSHLKTTELYLHPSIKTLQKAVNDHLASEFLKNIRLRQADKIRINYKGVSSG